MKIDESLSDDDATVSVVLGKEYLQNALNADEIKLLGSDKPITGPPATASRRTRAPRRSPAEPRDAVEGIGDLSPSVPVLVIDTAIVRGARRRRTRLRGGGRRGVGGAAGVGRSLQFGAGGR